MAVTFTKSYYHTPDDTTAYNTVTGVSVTSTIGEDINKYYVPFGTDNYELLSDNFTSSNIWNDVYTTSELQTRGLALYDIGSTPTPPQTTYIKKIYHENQEYIVGAGGDSSDITYDNTESGMTADNVQDAIDELQDSINGLSNNKYIESADSSNYKVSVVSTLPSTQVTNTIYIVTG